jgi:hypothetical protein
MAFLDIPSFPTESLHKFKAIVGLVLMFGGFFYLIDGIVTSEESLIDIKTKTEILKIKRDYLKNDEDKQNFRINGAQLIGQANKSIFLGNKLIALSLLNILVSIYGLSMAKKGFEKWAEMQELTDNALRKGIESKSDE